MKNILVTGGGGYIGSRLVSQLLRSNYRVRVLDIFVYGQDKLPRHRNLEVVVGDIRNIGTFANASASMDAVIHLASVSNDPGYELDPLIGLEINLHSFEPLVKAAKGAGVRKFIFPSSCSVYGSQPLVVDEETPHAPRTDYAICKSTCENILQQFHSADFQTYIVRPSTVCGLSLRQRLDLSVNALTNQIFHLDRVRISQPKRIRPSLHILDMVRVYLALLDKKDNSLIPLIYNVGYQCISLEAIAFNIQQLFGKKTTIEIVDDADQRSYFISSAKIGRELGFSPVYSYLDAAKALSWAFRLGILKDTFGNPNFYNMRVQKETTLLA